MDCAAASEASACEADGVHGCGTAGTSTVLATRTGALCEYCTVYSKLSEKGPVICVFGEGDRAVCEFGKLGRAVSKFGEGTRAVRKLG